MPAVRAPCVCTCRPLGAYSPFELRAAWRLFDALNRGNLYLA